MKPFGKMSGAWVLAITLGLTGASCAVQATTDHRPPTADRRLLTASEPDAATKAKVQVAYNKLPLHFEANQGQSNDQVKFLSHGKGYTLFLTSTEAVFTLRKPHKNSLAPVLGERARVRGLDPEQADQLNQTKQIEQTVVRMQLVGANPYPQVKGLDGLPGKSNYFLGNDPQKWHTNVPTYARVQYKDIYPGIDLIFYGNQRQLEHDFVVAPGADPKVIRLAFDGLPPHPVPLVAQPSWLRAGWKPAPLGEREPGEGQDGGESGLPLRIDDNGDLILHTEGGEIRLHKPRIYQEINGVKQPIPGGYVLLDLETQNSKLETQKVGFQVAAYDPTKPLVIDPTLSYSTYLGGSGNDNGYGIAVDPSGNAYVTGSTDSTDFPTASPFQAVYNGGYDVFVTKLNAAGSALVYSTYLGGSDTDWGGFGIAADSSGNTYVTGRTHSTDFPTASPLQAAIRGNSDVFVTKLNATGSLVYSTYLGGDSDESGHGIAADSSGNAYVTGWTYSADAPFTPADEGFPVANPFQATSGGPSDGFVTKINATGSALVYSTYLGGSDDDRGRGIAVDSSGNAYVTGETESADFPTASPFQATLGGGNVDGFVTKLNATGSALYSTYLGGSGNDNGSGIAADSSGNAYVTGGTVSTDFPTASPFQAAYGGGDGDAFVAKLNATGSALVYSTYLGGDSDESGHGIAADSSGNAYVTGETDSTDFPTVSPFQAANGGNEDVFVTKLDATGSALYSTYLGGSGNDSSFGIAVDPSGNAYVTGSTDYSADFPTVSPIQAAFGGGAWDAFVVKIGEGEVESEYYQVDFEADQGVYSALLIEDSTAEVLGGFDTGELCFGGPGQDYYEGGPSDQKFWLRLEDRPGGGQTMHILSRFANQPIVRVIPCDPGSPPQEGKSTLPRPWVGSGDEEPPQEWVEGGGTLGNPIQEPYEQCDLQFAGSVQVNIADYKGTYRTFRNEVRDPLRNSPLWFAEDVEVDWFRRSGAGYAAELRVDTRLCRQAVADTIQLVPEETVEDERRLYLIDYD